MTHILFEGHTADELLALPQDMFEGLVLDGEALVFRAGQAEMLGRFSIDADTLVLELGHIDGGGEGALPALAALAQRFADARQLAWIEWRVHAVHCARPNLKLRRVLERRGFAVRELPGVGECYWKRQGVRSAPAR